MTKIHTKIQRGKPDLLVGLPRLIARLSPTHQKMKYLKDHYYRIGAGQAGEFNVDSYLERTQFSPATRIFTDVHLRISPIHTFQIDTLILTERYVLLVEVKNLKDTVRFVKNPPHLEQIFETGSEVILDCPVYQLETNKANLNEWFLKRGISLETQGLLVLSNPNTKVKDVPHDFPIVYKKQLPLYLKNFMPAETLLSPNQIYNISKMIEMDRQQYKPFPLCSYYNINPIDLKTGLFCESCHSLLRRKTRKKWYCEHCCEDAENPLRDGINDWFMLMKNSITSNECRRFLALKDLNAARYALSKSLLIKKGNSTATFYMKGQK